MSGFSCWSSVFEYREAKGVMKQKKRDREDNHPTNQDTRGGRSARVELRRRQLGSRGRRVPRGPSLARGAPRAAPRRSPPSAWRAARARAARGGGGRRRRTEERGARPRAPPRARTARSPRAPRASHSDARARGPSRASPRTRRHTDARRRGGSLHRAERKEGQTANERTMIYTTTRTLLALLGCGGESRQTARPTQAPAPAPRGRLPSRCALDTGSLRAERRVNGSRETTTTQTGSGSRT